MEMPSKSSKLLLGQYFFFFRSQEFYSVNFYRKLLKAKKKIQIMSHANNNQCSIKAGDTGKKTFKIITIFNSNLVLVLEKYGKQNGNLF